MDAVEPAEGDDPPLTADMLADLQAGLLDDETAARVRQRVRTDPGARQTMEALNRVRRDVAALGSDAASAPPVDPALVDGIAAGLRAQPAGAAHAVRRGRLPRPARMAFAATGSGRSGRRGLVGSERAGHRAGDDAEQAHHDRTHHGVAASASDSAVGSADHRAVGPRAGSRAAERPAATGRLPGWSGLSGQHPGTRRPPGGHRRPSGRSACITR